MQQVRALEPHTDEVDVAELNELYSRLMDAWNAGSAARFAATFTADGDLVAFDGTHFTGRDAIVAFHQPLFDTHLRGSRLVGDVTDVHLLGPDIALLHALGGTLLRGETRSAPARDSIQTLVAVRQAGTWQIRAFQNTRVRPMGRNAGGTLFWLVGDWLWRFLRPKG